MGRDLNGGGSCCCVGSSSLSTQHKYFKNEAIDQNIYFSVHVAAARIFIFACSFSVIAYACVDFRGI